MSLGRPRSGDASRTPDAGNNSYARLPERFFTRTEPTPVAEPKLVRLNRELALELGLDPDWLASSEGVEVLAGKRLPEHAEPIALAYAGHQFGYFVPQLGDGRAILLGEVVDRRGVRRDIQLKGPRVRHRSREAATDAQRWGRFLLCGSPWWEYHRIEFHHD
jgi:uncharacterized protein YdiU (UPF0061 family)